MPAKKSAINPELAKVAEHFKGKGGNEEAESILVDSVYEKKRGYVSIWSNRHDLTKIINRCGSAVISCKPVGDGFQLEIDRKAFRGLHCAFRNIK